MGKVNKEQIAVYSIIGMVILGMVLYAMSGSKSSVSTTEAGPQKKVNRFAAPTDQMTKDKEAKESYKSALDIYEQSQPAEEEYKPKTSPIAFNPKLNNGKKDERQVEEPEKQTVLVDKPVEIGEKQQSKSGQSANIAEKKTNARIKKQVASKIPGTENVNRQAALKLNSDTVKTQQTTQEEFSERTLVSASQKKKQDPPEIKSPSMDSTSTVPVVVHGNHSVSNKGLIKLRVTKDSYINKHLIKAGQILTGSCNFDNDHLYITVNSFQSAEGVMHVKLYAYREGELGIFAPNSSDTEIANNLARNVGTRISIPTPLGSIGVGSATNKKSEERSKQVDLNSQYSLELSKYLPNEK